jgi:hypothetical protein
MLATSNCSVTATRKHLASIWRNGAEVIQFFAVENITEGGNGEAVV